MNNLENILELVKDNPADFSKFSEDIEQINPAARVISISKILGELNLDFNSNVIDIGTGYGYGAVLLNALGNNAIGLEINGKKLDEGMKYWDKLGIKFSEINDPSKALAEKGKLYFMKRDARNMEDFPNSSVDLITSFYISGYMAKEKAFGNISRILKPKSRLVITTEGPISSPAFIRGGIVKLASRILAPKNLMNTGFMEIKENGVYDRYIVTYEKS